MNSKYASPLVIASVIFALILTVASNTHAIVIVPSGSGNSVAPADDPGWLNVANRGIYLGNRWVLTAHHVGPGQTVFPGIGTFDFAAGSDVRITNPIGMDLTTNTDLVLYRLQTDPGLPSLNIAATTPAAATTVTLIADGAIRDSNGLIEWDVVENSPTEWIWTEVPSSGDYSGYGTSGFGKRWATNEVAQTVAEDPTLVEVDSGSGDVISFTTDFNLSGGMTNEGQAALGDSGGAIFSKNSFGVWELSGVIHSVGTYEDQPFPGQTAIDGNPTYAADLSAYRSQIQNVIGVAAVPEPGGLSLLVIALPMLSFARRRHNS